MKKTVIISFISCCAVVSAALGAGLTFAGFAKTDISQTTVQANGGERPSSIFFLPNSDWTADDAISYLYAYNSSNSDNEFILPRKTVSETLTGDSGAAGYHDTIYVYLFDSTKYNKLIFVRVNPTGLDLANIWANNWNQTFNLSFTSSETFYMVSGWKKVNTKNYAKVKRASISSSMVVGTLGSEIQANQ